MATISLSSPKQALVFGASGVSGWAIARECLVYPSTDTFARVVGLARQSLHKEEFVLEGEKVPERLDLLDDHVVEAFGKIPGIEKTTPMFFAAYAGHDQGMLGFLLNSPDLARPTNSIAYSSGNPFELLTKTNLALLKGAIAAVTAFCPKLEFLILQTGGKNYGFELLGVPGYLDQVGYTAPHHESKLPLPSPWGDMIFYTAQHKELIAASTGKSWTFAEMIPDIVVSFAPRTNPMCFAQTAGLFLSFYRDQKGVGAEVVFPGSGFASGDSSDSDT